MKLATFLTDSKTEQQCNPALNKDSRGPATAPCTQLQIHSTAMQNLCLELDCLAGLPGALGSAFSSQREPSLGGSKQALL